MNRISWIWWICVFTCNFSLLVSSFKCYILYRLIADHVSNMHVGLRARGLKMTNHFEAELIFTLLLLYSAITSIISDIVPVTYRIREKWHKWAVLRSVWFLVMEQNASWFELGFNYHQHHYCLPYTDCRVRRVTVKLHAWPVRLWHYVHISTRTASQHRNLLLIHGNIQYTENLACFCSSQSLL